MLEMSSIREGGVFGNLLVELLRRRKVPIDVDAVAITLSAPDDNKDFAVGAARGL